MSDPMSYWEELERPGPDMVLVDGVEVRRGSRVRLHPPPGADIFDLALAGQVGIVDKIECDMEENIHLVVVVEDDPGRDLGELRRHGHRFFFSPQEVEPLGAAEALAPPGFRVLIAGIGNVFLGDDGFGVALASRLDRVELPAGVKVVDYGIRGMDLAYALGDGWDAVIMLDATPRGEAPGTLYVIEADDDPDHLEIDAHGMDPVKVLALARTLGGGPLPRILIVGCEPQTRMTGDEDDIVADLSEPVRAALDPASKLVGSLLDDMATTAAPRKERPS